MIGSSFGGVMTFILIALTLTYSISLIGTIHDGERDMLTSYLTVNESIAQIEVEEYNFMPHILISK